MLTHWILKCIINAGNNWSLDVIAHWHCIRMMSLVGHERITVASWWKDHRIRWCSVVIMKPRLFYVARYWSDQTAL